MMRTLIEKTGKILIISCILFSCGFVKAYGEEEIPGNDDSEIKADDEVLSEEPAETDVPEEEEESTDTDVNNDMPEDNPETDQEEETQTEEETDSGTIAENTENEQNSLIINIWNEDHTKYIIGVDEENNTPVYASGFFAVQDDTYYFDPLNDNLAVKNTQKKVDGYWYLFDDNGIMLKGFQYISNQKKTVYYDPESGHMLYGMQTIAGSTYYFNVKTGAMTVGWLSPDDSDKKLYFKEDGTLTTGQKKIGGYWYYFDDTDGAMVRGWKYISSQKKTVYYDPDNGHMQYGQKKIDGKWYYLHDSTGAVQYGWKYIAKQKKTVYYHATNGYMLYGQQKINGQWYYLLESTGARVTGFKYISKQSKWVYYGSDGAMKHGSFTVGKVSYRADKSTGEIVYTYISGIPYYSQTDSRWSWVKIGNAGTIAQNGCGPAIGTSIINFYKGKGFTPVNTANLFNSWGHYNSRYGHGTDTGVWRVLANYYGLYFKNNLSLSEVKDELRKGRVVTAAVGRGTFVNGSYTHFILMYGLEGNRCWVYDPLNSGRNGRYSVDTIYSQRSHLYVDNIDGGPFIALGTK